jgi:hypothetical protein
MSLSASKNRHNSSKNTMKTIQQWMNHRALRQLTRSTSEIKKINSILYRSLEAEFKNKVVVSSHRESQLHCMVKNAAIATQLRFRGPYLLDQVKQHPLLANLKSIHFHVQSHTPEKAPARTRQVRAPSPDARSVIAETAAHCRHPALKSALLRLAKKTD